MPDDAQQQQEQPAVQGAVAGAAAGAAAAQQQGQQQPPARPDYIPEKFWDGKAGAPRVEDLAKSYGELERGRGKQKEVLRSEVMQEFFGQRPENPDGYVLTAPEDAADVTILTDVPEGFEFEPGRTYMQLLPDSKTAATLKQMAFDHGIPPAKVQALMAEAAREMGTRVPTQAEREQEKHEFFRSLGEDGQRRVQHLWGGLRNVLGPRADALDALVGNKAAVEALEELVARGGGPRFAPSSPGAGSPGALTEGELRTMQRDKRYTDPRHPEHAEWMAKVTEGYRVLYPSR